MKRLLTCLLLLLPISALAQETLYATQACGKCDSIPSGLYTIDPATGTPTLVGETGESITGLDFHPDTGVLYGTTTGNSTNPSSLITIDPATGAVTVIGPHGVDQAIIDLSFAPDGTLYGWAEPGDDSVVTINVTTGAATLVANSGADTAGCAFDMAPDGFLYLFGAYCESPLNPGELGDNAILKIDPNNGSVVDYWPIVSDLDWPCDVSFNGAWNAASHNASGTLYGFSGAGCGTSNRSLAIMDLATGVPTYIGDSLKWASGLAFGPDNGGGSEAQAFGIPTMQRTGLLITVFLFALLGGLMIYRRKLV